MLCGNCVAATVVAVSYLLKEFQYLHVGSSLFIFIFMQFKGE